MRGSDIVVDKELDEERSVADVHQQAKEVEGGVRVAEPHVVHHKESAKEHLGDLEPVGRWWRMTATGEVRGWITRDTKCTRDPVLLVKGTHEVMSARSQFGNRT